MRITKDRRTDFNDLKLKQPDRLRTGAVDIKNDTRPIRFSSPLYSPLTPDRLVIVHPTESNKGGFFGWTRTNQDGTPKAHQGVDIEACDEKNLQNGVAAAEDGVISRIGFDKDGYGHYIDIDHRDGYMTRYAHLSEVHVKKGQKVLQGELIGDSGKTGNADHPNIIPHLHFEIFKDGQRQDPIPFITELPPDRKLFLMIEGMQSPIANNLSTGGQGK